MGMIYSFDQLITNFRLFHKKIHKRLTHELNKQLMGLIDQAEKFAYRFSSEIDSGTIESCLTGLRKIKALYPEKLRPEDLRRYLDMGWGKAEIKILYGLTSQHLHYKLKMIEKSREDEARKDTGDDSNFLQIPEYIRRKKPEDWTDEDAFVVARVQLTRASAAGSIEASSKLIDRFRSFMQSDLKLKWEQVKILDNFFLSHFLPAVQKQLRINDPLPRILVEVETGKADLQRIKEICQKGRIDAKSIFRDVLKEISQEIREVAGMALENYSPIRGRLSMVEAPQPEMEKAVQKAKRRGKWVKKPNPEGAQAIFEKTMAKPDKPKGIMENIRPPAPTEPAETAEAPEPENPWVLYGEENGQG